MDDAGVMGGRIVTQEQATNLVRLYCQRAAEARDLCNLMSQVREQVLQDPDATEEQKESTVAEVNRAYQHWLMNYGCGVGSLVSMRRVGLISDNAYDLLMAEVFATLQPKVVGEVNHPVQPRRGIVLPRR